MSEPAAGGAPELSDEPARTEHEAEDRYQRTRDWDPFPDIAPALLNSADIHDYVRVTGMIWPFDPERLKAASYKVSIGNAFVYWDGNSHEHSRVLQDREKFHLEPNSIGFVTTKEVFRLPHYIGARFNLRISNVHRGILLGTGPLVDPGFEGRLLVPLHNLTANRYPFYEGDEFAWFEFTKVSPNYWNPGYMKSRRQGVFRAEYKAFPETKLQLPASAYLSKAWPGPIPSSIPTAIAEYAAFAEDSKKAAENAEKTLSRIAWIATIGVVVATLGVVVPSLFASWQLVGSVKDSVSELSERLNHSDRDIARLTKAASDMPSRHLGDFDPASVKRRLEDIDASLSRLEAELDALRGQLAQP